jgi:glycosyltransferase involved in cell wall biosynthesis
MIERAGYALTPGAGRCCDVSLGVGAFALVVLPGEESLAEALRDDLHEHHPGLPVVVVVTDETSTLHEIAARTLAAGVRDVLEGWSGEDLRAALVPFVLERVRSLAGPGAVVLLAPGLRVLRPLALPVVPTLGLVTNPGIAGVQDDGHEPDLDEAVRLGPFSHAMVIAGPEAGPLLAGWKATTHATRWATAPARPLFAIAAETAAAAGARSVSGEGLLVDPRWRWVSGAPWPAVLDLRSLRAAEPWLLDPGVRTPRTLLSDHPDLADFVDHHFARLTADGQAGPTPFHASLVRRWRSEGGTPGFDAWLTRPVSASPPSDLPRALAEAWRARPDLRAIMPLGLHQDAPVLSRWWLEHGHLEEPFPEPVRAAIAAVARREPVPAPDPTPGVSVAGYLGAALGLGRMARLLVEAARRADLPVSLVENHRTPSSATDDRPGELPEGLLHQLTLLAVTGDQTPSFVQDLPPDWRAGRRTIGVWAWELEQLPPEHQAGFAHVDEVWTISTFTRDAVAAVAPCAVEVVPLPVPLPASAPSGDALELRDRLGIPQDRQYVLFVMDLLSDLDRKNPVGLIEAHARAFPDRQGPLLVLKLMNGALHVSHAEQIRLLAARHGVLLVEEVLSMADLDLLMAGATAYVSLHRSEGFGLTIAEAMAHGVPTIATAYGGNLDFMDPSVSLLVPYELVDTPAGSAYAGGRWADPDLDAAAEAMRRLVAEPAFARELGQRGRAHIAEVCSWERTSTFLAERVHRAEALLAARAEAALPPPPVSLPRRALRRLSRARGR